MSKKGPAWEDQIRLHRPKRAVVFGSGMQAIPEGWVGLASVDQEFFTGLDKSHVPGHKGTIALGLFEGDPVLMLHGRIHSYEGYSKDQVCSLFPVLASWGIRSGLLFNATGGLDPTLSPGEMVGVSHIWDATGPNWNVCRGNVPWVEVKTTDNLTGIRKGRYAMVSGPSYETAAEVKALGLMGADLVGMSSAWEIQEGRRLGMDLELVSVVANLGTGLAPNPLTHQEVCLVMSQSESQIVRVSGEWLVSQRDYPRPSLDQSSQ